MLKTLNTTLQTQQKEFMPTGERLNQREKPMRIQPIHNVASLGVPPPRNHVRGAHVNVNDEEPPYPRINHKLMPQWGYVEEEFEGS